jgi:hypothetical protein
MTATVAELHSLCDFAFEMQHDGDALLRGPPTQSVVSFVSRVVQAVGCACSAALPRTM